MDALYRSGYWFDPVFGRAGDAGVVDSGWGLSFLTPEWMLTRACPPWQVVEFASGRNEGSQDVFVLKRGEPLSAEGAALQHGEASSGAMRETARSRGSRR
jgi:hypothetical protein